MGSEFNGYATDITTSYPVSGKFTDDQRAVHQAVLEAQSAVLHSMKPGVKWTDMHRLSERVILKHLLEMGVLVYTEGIDTKNPKVQQMVIDELMKINMASLFMPHGLGHFMGMTVHGMFCSLAACAVFTGVMCVRQTDKTNPTQLPDITNCLFFALCLSFEHQRCHPMSCTAPLWMPLNDIHSNLVTEVQGIHKATRIIFYCKPLTHLP